MKEIKLAKTTPQESLKKLADDLREVADDIEAGKMTKKQMQKTYRADRIADACLALVVVAILVWCFE